MTSKLAMYIRIARHHISGTPIDEEDRISQERACAIEGFQMYIARRMDILIRMEVFSLADWFWNATGPAVRFSVDGHSFLLGQQNEGCQFFLEADGNKVPLTVLSDQDREFADHFLMEIGDVLARKILP